jgi:arylsulfatase A-like enzyme
MSEPWLLQVSFNAAHEPFHVPPAELIHTPLVEYPAKPELHRALLEALDTELGRVLDAIPDDVRSRTTIIVLGDNGTPIAATDPEDDRDRMKGTVFDGGVHVPLFVSGPLVRTPGVHTEAFAHVVDLFPTVADIVGAPAGDVDGVSLLPVFDDPSAQVRSTLYTERFDPGGDGPFSFDQRALRNDRFKLVVDEVCHREQLYEYVPGAIDEGPDLLLAGPLTAEQQQAHDALRAELDETTSGLVFASHTWPEMEAPPIFCGSGLSVR